MSFFKIRKFLLSGVLLQLLPSLFLPGSWEDLPKETSALLPPLSLMYRHLKLDKKGWPWLGMTHNDRMKKCRKFNLFTNYSLSFLSVFLYNVWFSFCQLKIILNFKRCWISFHKNWSYKPLQISIDLWVILVICIVIKLPSLEIWNEYLK